MARRPSRPIRLEWETRASSDARPADLVRSAVVPAADGKGERGRLFHGDNLAIMLALASELEGHLDLVYLDPPFQTGKAFSARIGTGEDSRRPTEWKTRPGYDDHWPDLAAYLEFLRPRLELMHRLLAPTGTLYVHLDWRAAAYVRVLLDEIFGPDRLLNEIIWLYHGPSPIRTAFSRKHDTILAYTKSAEYTFNPDAVRTPYDAATRKAFASSPRAGFGKMPDLERGKIPEDWWYFPVVARLHTERTGYPTQKPLALLERIARASSRPGDLVADFFCGSGTSLVAAHRLGRRWLGCDASGLACATTYRRLLLEETTPGFSLWTTSPPDPRDLGKRASVSIDGAEVEVGLRSKERFTSLEVDWAYDGKTFRSRGRAVQPWRISGALPSIRHRYPRGGRHRIAIRAVNLDGIPYQAESNIELGPRTAGRAIP